MKVVFLSLSVRWPKVENGACFAIVVDVDEVGLLLKWWMCVKRIKFEAERLCIWMQVAITRSVYRIHCHMSLANQGARTPILQSPAFTLNRHLLLLKCDDTDCGKEKGVVSQDAGGQQSICT